MDKGIIKHYNFDIQHLHDSTVISKTGQINHTNVTRKIKGRYSFLPNHKLNSTVFNSRLQGRLRVGKAELDELIPQSACNECF